MTKVTGARIEYGRTFNLDSFESVRLGITLDVAPADGETMSDADIAATWEQAKEIVKQQAMPILGYRNARRKAEIKFVLKNLPNDLQETARKVLGLAHDDQAEQVIE